jgi:hypothetical protein
VSPMPTDMVDRWADRSEPGPGQGLLYWHMLFHDQPQVQALAKLGQDRLAAFPGLRLVPSKGGPAGSERKGSGLAASRRPR